MTNRKTKQKEEWLEEITKEWQLSIIENEFLETTFDLIEYRDDITNLLNIINFYYAEDWDNLLEMIPTRKVKNYAESEFDLVEKEDCSIEDFSDDEIEEEYAERGLGRQDNIDIASSLQLEELIPKFLKADFDKREQILKLL